MRRSLALFAVAAAVAAAAIVVAAGLNSRGGDDAVGASPSPSGPTTGVLPSGHPSIASSAEQTAAATPTPEPGQTVAKLEAQRQKDPGNVQVLVDLGNAYFMRQRLDQAEQAFTKALEQKPGDPAAQVGLAMVWHARGDSKRAEQALKAVLASHPDDQDAHYTLAIVYFSAGRVDLARQEWQTAADIDPSSVTGKRSQSFVNLIEEGASSSPSAN